MTFHSCRIAPHNDGGSANLGGPFFCSLDKASSYSATPVIFPNDEANNFNPEARFQYLGSVRLHPPSDVFFYNRYK